MELVEVYRCPEFVRPVVFTARFKHVKNAGEIRARIVKAATMAGSEGDAERDALDFAFINAALITSPLHLQTAAVQALIAESEKTMRTKTVHSEILWNLSPSNNISEAFRRYGVSDGTTDLIVMHVATWEREDVLERMRAVVDGELVRVAGVSEATDWAGVAKEYGLELDDEARVDNVVVSAVATKGI